MFEHLRAALDGTHLAREDRARIMDALRHDLVEFKAKVQHREFESMQGIEIIERTKMIESAFALGGVVDQRWRYEEDDRRVLTTRLILVKLGGD